MKTSKRLFDLFWASLGLALIWPVLVLIAIMVKCGDGGPVFFRQERVGRDGKLFRVWKFRTMITEAEKRGKQLTVGSDPRITRVGHLLRRLKLDELPQLFNVLVGQMSFVGPRPEVPGYVELYTPEQKRILELVPGVTDPASIKYLDENDLLTEAADPERYYVEHIMPDKIRTSLEYGDRATVWSDFMIMVKTLLKSARRG